MSSEWASDLAAMLNQTVSWKAKTGQDRYNVPTYDTTDIAARKEQKRRMVKDQFGDEVVSMTTVFTQSAIGLEDEIDDEKVISVQSMVDGEGQTTGYEVFL